MVYDIALIQGYLRRLSIPHGPLACAIYRCYSRRTGPRVSNASQSAVPIGNRPIELHLYSPNASVSMLARI